MTPPVSEQDPAPVLPIVSRYWPSLVIEGRQIALHHLDPQLLPCSTTDAQLPDPLLINVRFSDHCFSERYDPAAHAPALLLPWCRQGSNDPRAFDQLRHALSRALPGLVTSLPAVRVNFTTELRNYVYAATVPHPDQTTGDVQYGIFFQLKQADTASAVHLDLTVVSAYSPDRGPIGVRKRPENIRFRLLAGKIYRGEPIKPPRR